MLSRNLKSALALVLVIALLLPFCTTQVSAAYENTYTNTGNMRDDIIGVALTQVGYEEGYNNYTKYGVWYGLPNSPWCGMFVSWCAAQAGIPTSVLKRTGVANPSNFGLSYQSGTNYKPQKGDLFFKSGFTHVGLVYYTEGDYFYTIEGNTSTTSYDGTSVMIRRRKISEFYFSSPNYSGSSSSSSSGCSHSYTISNESAHPHKEYRYCSRCGASSYTGNTSSNRNCTTCIQAACNHNFDQWAKASDTKHSRTCSKCGLNQSNDHDWVAGEIITEATCVEAGSQNAVCSVCGAESTKEIPATNEHTYGAPSYINEETHQLICTVCGNQEIAVHTPSSNWKNDTFYHWTSCADCGGRISNTEHRFSSGCLAPCDTCGYILESGHKLGDDTSYDTEKHWHICQRCGMDADMETHTFSSNCDELCDDCGYKRNTGTVHDDIFCATEAGHWRICNDCGRESMLIAHTADRNCNAWDDQICIQCKFVLISSDRHEHTFDSCFYDSNTHWGTCICGEELEPQVHTWSIQTGKCSVCNATHKTQSSSNNFFVNLLNTIFKK